MTDRPHSRDARAQGSPASGWGGVSALRGTRGAPPAHLGWLIFWMGGTLLSFIVAALSVRALSKNFSAFEIMSVRSAGGLIILFLLTVARPQLLEGLRARRMG